MCMILQKMSMMCVILSPNCCSAKIVFGWIVNGKINFVSTKRKFLER